MRTEYRMIVDAGFVLQLDDARAATTYDRMVPPASFDEYRKWVAMHMEVLNHAIAACRRTASATTCAGEAGPARTTDVPLKDIVDLILSARVGAYVIEGANPRHEHEWKVWQDVKLPEGKVLIPGVISHATNVVEHPELVADGSCGSRACSGGRMSSGHATAARPGPVPPAGPPSIMWAKLESGCSTTLVAWLMTPGISTLPSGSFTSCQTFHSCSWRGLAPSIT